MIHNTEGQLRNEIRQIHFTEGNHVTRFVGFTLQRGQPRDPLIDTTLCFTLQNRDNALLTFLKMFSDPVQLNVL